MALETSTEIEFAASVEPPIQEHPPEGFYTRYDYASNSHTFHIDKAEATLVYTLVHQPPSGYRPYGPSYPEYRLSLMQIPIASGTRKSRDQFRVQREREILIYVSLEETTRRNDRQTEQALALYHAYIANEVPVRTMENAITAKRGKRGNLHLVS